MAKLPTNLLAAVSIVASIAVIFLGVRAQSEPKTTTYAPSVVNAELPEEETVGSPDGVMTLTMKTEKGQDENVFTFYVTEEDKKEVEIYRKSVSSDSSMSVPFNTFSPDNKYLLLKEESLGTKDYFIVRTSGETFAGGLQRMDITESFLSRYEDYKSIEATGWGGISLVVVNTERKSGGKGPSFWFDATTGSFIQLSSLF